MPNLSQLAREIAAHLGVPLGDVTIKPFADGEIGIQVNENVRGKDVYIIQPTSPPGTSMSSNSLSELYCLNHVLLALARWSPAVRFDVLSMYAAERTMLNFSLLLS